MMFGSKKGQSKFGVMAKNHLVPMSTRQERQRLKTLQKKFLNGGLNDKSELLSLAIKNANQKG